MKVVGNKEKVEGISRVEKERKGGEAETRGRRKGRHYDRENNAHTS